MPSDRPGQLERLAGALLARDLSLSSDHRGAVDIVAALGLASRRNDITSRLLRLYVDRTPEAMRGAREAVEGVVRRLDARKRWGLDDESISRVAHLALSHHLKPACSHCSGRGYRLTPGTPSLSHKTCEHCRGSGSRQIGKRLRTQVSATISKIEHINSMTEASVKEYLG